MRNFAPQGGSVVTPIPGVARHGARAGHHRPRPLSVPDITGKSNRTTPTISIAADQPPALRAGDVLARFRVWWHSKTAVVWISKAVLFAYGALLISSGVILFVLTDVTPILPFWLGFLGAACVVFGLNTTANSPTSSPSPGGSHAQ